MINLMEITDEEITSITEQTIQIAFEHHPTVAIRAAINELCKFFSKESHKWWLEKDGVTPKDRNIPETLMLIVSEVAEAMEGIRKDVPDDHIPTRKMFQVELADAAIRLFDLAGHRANYDGGLGAATVEKMLYNRHRVDHKPENREKPGGKKF